MTMDEIYNQLGIMQLSDSFFPSGLFTTSNGLEIFIHDRKIKNADDLCNLIQTFIEQQIGPSDCIVVSNTFDAIKEQNLEKIIEIDELCFSMKLIKEIRDTLTRSGIQVLRCVKSFSDNKILSDYQNCIKNKECTGVFPVAFAIASHSLGIQKPQSLSMMLYGFSVSMVSAALRMGLIEHIEAQKIIHKLKSIIATTVSKNINKKTSQIWQFTPEIDIVQMSHEQMNSKMFVT